MQQAGQAESFLNEQLTLKGVEWLRGFGLDAGVLLRTSRSLCAISSSDTSALSRHLIRGGYSATGIHRSVSGVSNSTWVSFSGLRT